MLLDVVLNKALVIASEPSALCVYTDQILDRHENVLLEAIEVGPESAGLAKQRPVGVPMRDLRVVELIAGVNDTVDGILCEEVLYCEPGGLGVSRIMNVGQENVNLGPTLRHEVPP
jgi:hypothetical protein